jgi:hypothetical protein
MFLPIASVLLFAGLAAATLTAKRADNCVCGYKDSNGYVWVCYSSSNLEVMLTRRYSVNPSYRISLPQRVLLLL